jgi:hypothetical protein
MTNKKQQTAVEWYIEKLLDLDYEYAKGLITLGVWSERKNSLIQQAKKMEKERIVKAVNKGWKYNEDGFVSWMGEQYYNETFGGKQ